MITSAEILERVSMRDAIAAIERAFHALDGVVAAFDAATGRLRALMDSPAITNLRTEQGVIRPVAGSGKNHPWDVISAEDKVRLINGLLSRELRQAMPQVLAGVGAR